jgi:hypothetical protein
MNAFRGANAAIGCPSEYDKETQEVCMEPENPFRCCAADDQQLRGDDWPTFAPDAEGVRATLRVNGVVYGNLVPRVSDTGAAGWYAFETIGGALFPDCAEPGAPLSISATVGWPERNKHVEVLLCDGKQDIPNTPGCFFAVLMPNQRAHATVQLANVDGARRITQVCLSVNLDDGPWV